MSERNIRKFDIVQDDQLIKIIQYALYALDSKPEWHVVSAKNLALAEPSDYSLHLRIGLPSGRILDIGAFCLKGNEESLFQTVAR